MAEIIKIKITPAVAAYVAAGVSCDEKLRGLESFESLSSADQVMLVFCLMREKDEIVKNAANTVFCALSEDSVLSFLEASLIHPAILDAIAHEHFSNHKIVKALLGCQTIAPQTAAFLEEVLAADVSDDFDGEDFLTEDIFGPAVEKGSDSESQAEVQTGDEPGVDLPEEPDVETQDKEEYLSKYKLIQLMGISEKIKMALTGDKEWRSILIKDSNKLVSSGVIKNPRITDGEILTIIKVGAQNDEIIRLICANKEWIKNYTIRKALIENPKTPLTNSLRYLSTLNEKDISGYAKSKNISSVIATQAKRLILAKKRN